MNSAEFTVGFIACRQLAAKECNAIESDCRKRRITKGDMERNYYGGGLEAAERIKAAVSNLQPPASPPGTSERTFKCPACGGSDGTNSHNYRNVYCYTENCYWRGPPSACGLADQEPHRENDPADPSTFTPEMIAAFNGPLPANGEGGETKPQPASVAGQESLLLAAMKRADDIFSREHHATMHGLLDAYSKAARELAQSPAAKALFSQGSWEEIAKQENRNAVFYKDIVRQCGELFGEAAKTSDDGSIQQDVLALKVPELIRKSFSKEEDVRRLVKLMPRPQNEGVQFGNVWFNYDKICGWDGNDMEARERFYKGELRGSGGFAKQFLEWCKEVDAALKPFLPAQPEAKS